MTVSEEVLVQCCTMSCGVTIIRVGDGGGGGGNNDVKDINYCIATCVKQQVIEVHYNLKGGREN